MRGLLSFGRGTPLGSAAFHALSLQVNSVIIQQNNLICRAKQLNLPGKITCFPFPIPHDGCFDGKKRGAAVFI